MWNDLVSRIVSNNRNSMDRAHLSYNINFDLANLKIPKTLNFDMNR